MKRIKNTKSGSGADSAQIINNINYIKSVLLKNKMAVVLIVFAVIFLISAFMVIRYFWTSHSEAAAFDDLRVQTSGDSNVLKMYAALHEQNPDFFGWIKIEDTEIDYPVMYTPQDPEHYLHRAFDGSSSKAGVPFIDGSCFQGCGNYIIYGHHMKNGSMFAGLLDYADKSFWETHPTIRFDTLDSTGEYAVVGAFYSQVYDREETGVFKYYDQTDLSDQAAFEGYVAQVKEAALYDTSISASFGDELITLSTCDYHSGDGRFVVVAKRTK